MFKQMWKSHFATSTRSVRVHTRGSTAMAEKSFIKDLPFPISELSWDKVDVVQKSLKLKKAEVFTIMTHVLGPKPSKSVSWLNILGKNSLEYMLPLTKLSHLRFVAFYTLPLKQLRMTKKNRMKNLRILRRFLRANPERVRREKLQLSQRRRRRQRLLKNLQWSLRLSLEERSLRTHSPR